MIDRILTWLGNHPKTHGILLSSTMFLIPLFFFWLDLQR